MDTKQSGQLASISLILISIIMLVTLGPWCGCCLFVLAFAFDAPGSSRDPMNVLSVILFCSSYPLLVIGMSVLGGVVFKKSGKWLLSFFIIIFPAILVASLFAYMIYASTPDHLELASFKKMVEKKFIKTCAYGNSEDVKEYLSNGLDPNLTSPRKMTPLLASYIGRNIENFETLLKNGADPNFIPLNDIDMHVAGYILWVPTEDWKKDGVPFIKMLFKYGLDPTLKTKFGSLAEFAYNAREKEYLQVFKDNGVDFAFARESKLVQAIIFQRWDNALFLMKSAKANDILKAMEYLNDNIRKNKTLAPEEQIKRQKLMNELGNWKSNINDGKKQKQPDDGLIIDEII